MSQVKFSKHTMDELIKLLETLMKSSDEKDFEIGNLKCKIKNMEDAHNKTKLQLETQCMEYRNKLTKCEDIYGNLQEKSKQKNSETDLLSLIEEQKRDKIENIVRSETDFQKICPKCDQLTLELEIAQQENSTHLTFIQELEKTNKHLLNEQQNVRQELRLLLEPAEELQKKIESHKTNLSILTATTYAENNTLKLKLEGIQHQNRKLCDTSFVEIDKNLNVHKSEIERLEQINNKITVELTDKDNELKQAQTVYNALKMSHNVIIAENIKNLNVIDRLIKDSADEQNKIFYTMIHLKEDNEKLITLYEMLFKEKESYAMDLKKNAEIIIKNSGELGKIMSDMRILRQSVRERTSTIKFLEQEVHNQKLKNAELKQQLDDTNSECSRLKINIKTCESKQQKAEPLKRTIMRLQKRKEEDDKRISGKQTKIEQLSQDKINITRNYENTIENQKELINRLQKEKLEDNKVIIQKQIKIEHLRKDNINGTKNFENAVENQKGLINRLQKEKEEDNKLICEKQTKIEELYQEKINNRYAVENQKQLVIRLQREKEEHNMYITALQAKIEELGQAKINTIRSYENDLAVHRGRNIRLEREKREDDRIIGEQQAKIEELRNSNYTLRRECQEERVVATCSGTRATQFRTVSDIMNAGPSRNTNGRTYCLRRTTLLQQEHRIYRASSSEEEHSSSDDDSKLLMMPIIDPPRRRRR